jgi:hypothetical protein
VNDQTDSPLLRAYAEHRSEPAFTELVRRHVDFVYSAALRMVHRIASAAMSRRNCAPSKSNRPKNFVGFPATRLFNG